MTVFLLYYIILLHCVMLCGGGHVQAAEEYVARLVSDSAQAAEDELAGADPSEVSSILTSESPGALVSVRCHLPGLRPQSVHRHKSCGLNGERKAALSLFPSSVAAVCCRLES